MATIAKMRKRTAALEKEISRFKAIPTKKGEIRLPGDIYINDKFIGRGKINISISTKKTKIKKIPKVSSCKATLHFENAKHLKKFLSLFQISVERNAEKQSRNEKSEIQNSK
jgi:hypothetical protein